MNQAAPQPEPIDAALDTPSLEAMLTETWRTPPGFWSALATVDHKIIGRRYIATALVFLALGGGFAA